MEFIFNSSSIKIADRRHPNHAHQVWYIVFAEIWIQFAHRTLQFIKARFRLANVLEHFDKVIATGSWVFGSIPY